MSHTIRHVISSGCDAFVRLSCLPWVGMALINGTPLSSVHGADCVSYILNDLCVYLPWIQIAWCGYGTANTCTCTESQRDTLQDART